MAKILKNTIILGTLVMIASFGFESKASDSYEEAVKKEQKAFEKENKELEREMNEEYQEDTYEEDRKREENEEKRRNRRENEQKEVQEGLEDSDDAGYDGNNMDKVRESDHKAWDKMHDKMDRPNTEEGV